MNRRAATFLLPLLTVLLLALSPARAASKDDGKTEIEIAIFAGGEGMAFYEYCRTEYERLHPGVRVNLYGDPRVDDKVRVRILEGQTPDLTNAMELKFHELIKEGRLQPFDPYLDQPVDGAGGKTWRDTFVPRSLDKWTRDGRAYGIPLSFFINTVWYNKALFERHGWKEPVTWDEFLALCERVKQAGIAEGTPGRPAYFPLAFQGMYPYYVRPLLDSVYFHAAGRQAFVDQQHARAGTFDNPNFVKTLTYVQTLATKYFQPGAMGMSHTQAQTEFFQGRTAMIPCGSWLKSEMMGKIPEGFRLGTFNLPIIEGTPEPHAINVFGGYFFLFKDAKQPREAVEFLKFMTSPAVASMFSRLSDVPTAVAGTQAGNLTRDLDDLVAIMNRATGVYGESFNDAVSGMRQHWNNVQLHVCNGERTPQQMAKDMEAAAAQVRNLLANPDQITVRHVAKPLLLLGILAAGALYWLITTTRAVFSTARRRPRLLISAGRERLPWGPLLVFLLPALILYTAFVIIPSVNSLSWSLHRWNGFTDMTWAGLLHFRRLLFEDDQFWIALNNNLFIMFVIPAFVLPISLFLAVCINRGLWGSSVFRVVFFFPNIIGGVAATLLWLHLYNPRGGPVNALLTSLGLSYFTDFPWLSQDNLYTALVPMSVWAACGFNMILFLAAMQNIPQELYEAADLDGATPWQQFWTVTLPMIWSAVSVSVVFLVIGGMKAFEVIWLLTNQQPSTANHVVGTYMIQELFWEFHVGQATAIAILLFLIVLIGTAATLKLMNRHAVDAA